MEKKTKINLLAIQMESVIGEVRANIDKVEKLLVNALENKKADFVFLPEVWTVGWDCPSFPLVAEEILNSEALKMLQKIKSLLEILLMIFIMGQKSILK